MPKRIQRKRTKGWRMPEGAVYVGRPSKWGNPIHGPGAVEAFRILVTQYGAWAWVSGRPLVLATDIRSELRGKDLVCWCPLEDAAGNQVPCHADVLLEWANA